MIGLSMISLLTDNAMIQLKFGPTSHCVVWSVSFLILFFIFIFIANCGKSKYHNVGSDNSRESRYRECISCVTASNLDHSMT